MDWCIRKAPLRLAQAFVETAWQLDTFCPLLHLPFPFIGVCLQSAPTNSPQTNLSTIVGSKGTPPVTYDKQEMEKGPL